jgi:hypothetical protein
MNPILVFLIVLGACALGLGLFIALVAWAASRLDRANTAASGFQRDEPYTDPQARDANRWPVNDYKAAEVEPFADRAARLISILDAQQAEAADPTAPANLRHIPGQRKEQQ